jgi:hypothetical protein
MRKVAFQRRHFEFLARTIKDMPDPNARVLAALAFIEARPSHKPRFPSLTGLLRPVG